MKRYKKIFLSEKGDDRGNLVVAEYGTEIPFQINRVFYIYGTQKNVIRGSHANIESQFVLINLRGKCTIYCNDGINEDRIILDKPHEGIYIDKMVWKDMYDFSQDALLLILSNCIYNSNEYIRDYNEFLTKVKVGFNK